MDELKINKAYAEKYNSWRQKEELQKLKDKYGDIDEIESESSTSESEDENAEALTASIERDWLKTLTALKNKDPKIYEKDVKFYESDDDSESDEEPAKVKKEKPVYLKDYERKVILEKGGQLSDESDSEGEFIPQKPSYFEEQEEIKQSFKNAFNESESDSSDSEFLTKKVKSETDKEKEEDEYLVWSEKQKEGQREEKQAGIELGSLKQFWNDPKLDDGEKFLRDFILKQQYLEKDADRIPSYDEIVNDGDGLSDDEENVERQEEFERKYNFRYEEPDQDFIKSFPRTIDDTVRRKESKRAEKRKELKDRKKMEKDKRREEIKQLKNLKKQEIIDKIDKLKEITGNQSLPMKLDDLEEDFDPKKHDEMMKACFDEDYYNEGEEEMKPVFTDDDEDLNPENWDNWTGPEPSDNTEEIDEPHIDDPDFVMDADYDPTKVVEKSSKKKKSKFKQALSKAKPVFDPEKKSFEEYFNEYYSLDYEDLIDETPCRFKYRSVLPNDFGLSVNEVLTCRDKELNGWVSLKKMSQYRTPEEEMEDLQIYSHKSKNVGKKGKILTSLVDTQDMESTKAGIRKRKRRKKKKKNGNTSATITNEDSVGTVDDDNVKDEPTKSSPVKKKKANTTASTASEPVNDKNPSGKDKDENITASPEFLQKKKKTATSATAPSPGTVENITTNSQSPNKKRKMKDADKVNAKKLKTEEASTVSLTTNKTPVGSKNVKQVNDMTVLKDKSPVIKIKTPSADKEEKNDNKTDISSTKKGKNKKKLQKQLSENDKDKSVQGAETTKVNSSSLTKSDGKDGDSISKKKKKKNKKKKLPQLSDERLMAYGINPKKLKYMKTDNFKHKSKEKE